MKFLLLGFGASVGVVWLSLIGREALAKEEAACLTRRLLMERRAAAWKALKP